MKALRLVIHQSSANYKKEETVDNKMTYPLPPFSTVIGALHNACGYREYKAMDISIQGRFRSMHRKPYTDFCFLNSTQDDRGILVKMKNADMLSNAYEEVASAKKPQGNSFRNGITIQVHNEKLLKEFRNLKDLKDEIDQFKKDRLNPVLALLKRRKKSLSDKRKKLPKDSEEYVCVEKRERELKDIEKQIKDRVERFQKEQYTLPISRFRTLTKSMKFYEILDDVELIIHVRASEEVLNDLYNHRFDIKSIGRSEDFVSVEDAQIVELAEESDDEIGSSYSAYVDCELVKSRRVFPDKKDADSGGTQYFLNKNYEIKGGKRVFQKKKVLYVSGYGVEEFGNGLYLDTCEGKNYIVNFL